jgi:hypothetical protein
LAHEVLAACAADGVTDDTPAINAAKATAMATGAEVVLPAGLIRVTGDITSIAPSTPLRTVYRGSLALGYSPALKIRGAHMLTTTIIADYDGDPANGAVIRYDTVAGRSYQTGGSVRHLSVTQAPGRTGLNGISATALWWSKVEQVMVFGLSGSAIKAPWRPDINPTLSDVYQAHALKFEHVYTEDNAGWGFDLGAGQSPGIYDIEQCLIRKNAKGGIRSTTGQCRIIGNNFQDNGTHALGGSGALLFDTMEGPSFVPLVEHNEFDNNFNWHMNLRRVRGIVARQNRFLSGTYESSTSFVRQSGTAFMRPYVHVTMGAGSANECWSPLFEQNYHRSVTGPGVTTASVIGYTASSGAVARARLIRNDFGPMPADGLVQNSTGLAKFAGMPGDTTILDP